MVDPTIAVPGYAQQAHQQSQEADIAALKRRLSQARSEDEARRVAKEFESVFLSQMMQYMFAGIKNDHLFGGGAGEEVYRSFLHEEYGKAIAEQGGIGIADAVTAEILRLWGQDPSAAADTADGALSGSSLSSVLSASSPLLSPEAQQAQQAQQALQAREGSRSYLRASSLTPSASGSGSAPNRSR